MPRAGDRLDHIRYAIAARIVFKDKLFLSLFDVEPGCGVQKAETNGGIDNFSDTTEIHRPDNSCMGFDSNQSPGGNWRAWIGYPDPPQVELFPSLESDACSLE